MVSFYIRNRLFKGCVSATVARTVVLRALLFSSQLFLLLPLILVPVRAQVPIVPNDSHVIAHADVNTSLEYLDANKSHFAGVWSSVTTYNTQDLVMYLTAGRT